MNLVALEALILAVVCTALVLAAIGSLTRTRL